MYDDIDMAYEQAVTAYQQKDYFKALSVLFASKQSRSEFKKLLLGNNGFQRLRSGFSSQ